MIKILRVIKTMKKKYQLHPKQAALIIVGAMKEGVPDEYLPNLLEAANRGYLLEYGDNTIGEKPNEREYDIDEIKLLIKSLGNVRGN